MSNASYTVGFTTSFGFGGGTPPLNLQFSSKNIPLSEEIDYLSSASLIAFFNTIQQVEGLTGVVIGLLDGIKAGVIDDKQFIEFVVSNIAYGGTYSYLLAKAEIDLWRTDPLKRATEMTNMTRQFVQDVVFKKLEATRQKLSTWKIGMENFSENDGFTEGHDRRKWPVATCNTWGGTGSKLRSRAK